MKTKLFEIAINIYGFCVVIALVAFLFGVGIEAK